MDPVQHWINDEQCHQRICLWGGQVGKERKLDEKCNFCGREALPPFPLIYKSVDKYMT